MNVTFDTTDQATLITDIFAGNTHNRTVTVTGTTVTLGRDALDFLAEHQSEDTDGHYDGKSIWIDGIGYPVNTAPASTYLATVDVDGIISAGAPAIGVDECRNGAIVATPWTRDLTADEIEARDWNALLTATGWTVTSGWTDTAGVLTAVVERA